MRVWFFRPLPSPEERRGNPYHSTRLVASPSVNFGGIGLARTGREPDGETRSWRIREKY